jgi:ABC-type glycerol-3-phosphate transport system substrate-binding protein
MSKPSLKFNPNWLAFFFLFVVFIVSAIRFYVITREPSSGDGGASSRGHYIRVAHWQLEPGFRDAMQWAIDEYNQLPQVKEAGIIVEQIPISERVYAQFMNIHLISGTAPDIAVKKDTNLIRGDSLAKFFMPIGSYIESSNPYNALEYQVPDLPEDLSQFLAESPWRDTFYDGLQGGYEEALSDYYAVPICTWGGRRIIYNLKLLKDVKTFALQQLEQSPEPEWLSAVWLNEDRSAGYLPRASGLAWLREDALPQTLGQLFLYFNAVQAYKEIEGLEYLVPVAASNSGASDVANLYQREFMSVLWEQLSLEEGRNLSSLETMAGFERGIWNFESPSIRQYFEFLKDMTSFYPKGFLGLDRDQAQRRFVLGQAAVFSTGGWNVTGIIQGINQRANPEDHFEIAIAPNPMPAPGERWAEFLPMRLSEADVEGAVPFAINKQSPNFEGALDFLYFLTSHRIQQGFSERAGWLPVAIGTKPPELVKVFMPIFEGLPPHLYMTLESSVMPSSIRNAWTSTIKLYQSGDIDYEGLSTRITDVLKDPKIGMRTAWLRFLTRYQDRTIAFQRSVSVERLGALMGSDEAAERERSNTYLNLVEDEGVLVKRWWHDLYPNEAYPEH